MSGFNSLILHCISIGANAQGYCQVTSPGRGSLAGEIKDNIVLRISVKNVNLLGVGLTQRGFMPPQMSPRLGITRAGPGERTQ